MSQIITRQDAKAQGLTRYFTGRPCAHGHVAERLVSNGACIECHRARKQDWYENNKDTSNAAKKAWAARNPERARAARLKFEENNRELIRKLKREWRARNPEKIRAKNAKWLAKNRDRMRELNATWYQANKDKARARDVRRRVGLRRSTASWDQELTNLVVNEASDLAARREAITGSKWHIDHMIPLKGRKASGLHVWSNLQVIPGAINAKKNNRLVLTTPGEWIRLT